MIHQLSLHLLFYISHLLTYVRPCSHYSDFFRHHCCLRDGLLDQGNRKIHLIRCPKSFISDIYIFIIFCFWQTDDRLWIFIMSNNQLSIVTYSGLFHLKLDAPSRQSSILLLELHSPVLLHLSIAFSSFYFHLFIAYTVRTVLTTAFSDFDWHSGNFMLPISVEIYRKKLTAGGLTCFKTWLIPPSL